MQMTYLLEWGLDRPGGRRLMRPPRGRIRRTPSTRRRLRPNRGSAATRVGMRCALLSVGSPPQTSKLCMTRRP